MQLIQTLFLLVANCFTPAQDAHAFEFGNKDKVDLIVKEGSFTVNKIKIGSDWGLQYFKQALGTPTVDDGSKLAWHTKGVVIWKSGNEVSQLLVQFRYDPEETAWYTSDKWFSGTITIEGQKIPGNTSISELRTKLPMWNWEKNASGWQEGHYMGLFLYFAYDEAGKNILWIDFGTD